MATAFGTLANQGVKVPLTPVLRVENYRGEVLHQVDTEDRAAIVNEMNLYPDDVEIDGIRRVMDRAPAYLTAHIMQDNQARTGAFGPNSQLVIPDQIVSVKTGTTNDLKDNWTIGFTPEYLVATWVGNNDGAPMNPYLVSGVTGAAPIWNDLMTFLLSGKEAIIPDKPPSVTSAGVCAHGLPPSAVEDEELANCQVRYEELYWREGKPSKSRQITKEIWIKEDTNLPPEPGEEADNLKLEEHTLITDPTIEEYCLDCAYPTTEEGNVQYQPRTIRVN
jgi:membrane peptidoglycan carboxypeptidase